MKKALSIIISLALLIVIYHWKIDISDLFEAFSRADNWFLLMGVGTILPLTLIIAWRFNQLMPSEGRLSFLDALGLTLSAGSLNMLLPLKMGDIAKALFMRDSGHFTGEMSLSLVTFEKVLDMVCLLSWCTIGLLLYPYSSPAFLLTTAFVICGFVSGTALLSSNRFAIFCFRQGMVFLPARFHDNLRGISENWVKLARYFFADSNRTVNILSASLMIWFLQLLQIWLFAEAMGGSVPFLFNLAFSPLVVLAGIMPFTFAGIGTRDVALIFLFQQYIDAPIAAAVALLCTSRYILPALAGLPFLDKYMRLVKKRRFDKQHSL